MIEYQSVIMRLTGKTRDDEEAITDEMNERARMGWVFHSSTALPSGRLVMIFTRDGVD